MSAWSSWWKQDRLFSFFLLYWFCPTEREIGGSTEILHQSKRNHRENIGSRPHKMQAICFAVVHLWQLDITKWLSCLFYQNYCSSFLGIHWDGPKCKKKIRGNWNGLVYKAVPWNCCDFVSPCAREMMRSLLFLLMFVALSSAANACTYSFAKDVYPIINTAASAGHGPGGCTYFDWQTLNANSWCS